MKVKSAVIAILVPALSLTFPSIVWAAPLSSGQKVAIATAAYGCMDLDDLKTFEAAETQANTAHDDAAADNAVQNAMESSCDFIQAGSTGAVTGFSGGSYVQVQMDDSTEDNWFDLQDVTAH
jgi:hypothetical protein